jgi:hypothetical protein
MGLFWELFQEHQLGQRQQGIDNVADHVSALDDDLTWLYDVVGKMAQRIDELEAQLSNGSPTPL